MILAVDEVWVGYMDGVEGVTVVINQGRPTQQILSMGMWVALMAGTELCKRAGQLILESQLDLPMATAEYIKRLDS